MHINHKLNPKQIGRFLGLIALFLALQSLLTEFVLETMLPPNADGLIISLIDLFSVNAEGTIPTWFATMLLFVTAVLIGIIANAKQRQQAPYRGHWVGLAAIFLYLSIDEGAVIHEIFSDPIQARFNTTGYLEFAWLILFVPLLLLFILAYFRFLLHLPAKTGWGFIAAGLLYIGGAVVIEAISANQYSLGGGVSFLYLAIATVEELFEMLGVIMLIVTLLDYTAQERVTTVFSANPLSLPLPSLRVGRAGQLTAVLLILGNVLLFSWATSQSSVMADFDPQAASFYQTISQQYEGQGVVILGLGELLEPANPAAPAVANSLLTLFDDVLVVTLPDAQASIVFASPLLPFDQAGLTTIVQESGESNFDVLDLATLRTLAASN